MINPNLAQQRSFFEAFGFLKLTGLLKSELATITSEFDAVFPQLGIKHDGTKRTMIVPFIDHRPGLSSLLDNASIVSAVENLLGPEFNYMGSDGNYYTGETTWHRDTVTPTNSYIKLALYLDPVNESTGALRVIPGSHTDFGLKHWDELELRDSENLWGMHQRELPGVALNSEPGDVLLFNHRLLHASFGGGKARRMFTMNLGRRAQTSLEISDLVSYGDTHCCGFGVQTPYGSSMIDEAPPERMKHLSQLRKYWPAALARHKARTENTQV